MGFFLKNANRIIGAERIYLTVSLLLWLLQVISLAQSGKEIGADMLKNAGNYTPSKNFDFNLSHRR